MSKAKGYFTKILFIDAETTGIAYGSSDPSFDSSTGESYQAVSWGVIVADSRNLEILDKLYLEVKWNGKSTWTAGAEKVHGLSLKYLEEHGVDEEEACAQIAELILKHWGPESAICTAGQNVATFDLFFLRRLFKDHGLRIKFGNRHIDTFSIGFPTFNCFNSDDLFTAVGIPERDPAHHNALDDAMAALTAVRTVRKLWTTFVDPNLE